MDFFLKSIMLQKEKKVNGTLGLIFIRFPSQSTGESNQNYNQYAFFEIYAMANSFLFMLDRILFSVNMEIKFLIKWGIF